MKIGGFQKLTLLDYPGKLAATVFTPGCDFRCPFCHNADLVLEKLDYEYYPEEIIDFLKTRKGKLDGICITGGEPLMQADIEDFMSRVKEIGMLIKLDTNGSYPEKLEGILERGLADYIAMDIKNVPSAWGKTTGLKNPEEMLEKTKRSMEIIKNSGVDYEFRTTVVKELFDPSSAKELGAMLKGCKRYYLQSYKESGELLCGGYSAWDSNTMQRILQDVRESVPNAELRGID